MVAFYSQSWITPIVDTFGTKWVLSSQTPDLYRGDGLGLSTNSYTEKLEATKLGINLYEDSSTEKIDKFQSSFAIAELLVFNKKLSLDEIKNVEQYLGGKYAMGLSVKIPITAGNHWEHGSISNSVTMRLNGEHGSSEYFYVNKHGQLSTNGESMSYTNTISSNPGDLYSIQISVDDPSFGYCVKSVDIMYNDKTYSFGSDGYFGCGSDVSQ